MARSREKKMTGISDREQRKEKVPPDKGTTKRKRRRNKISDRVKKRL